MICSSNLYGLWVRSFIHGPQKSMELKTRVILDDNLSDSLSVRIRASDDTNTSVEKLSGSIVKNNMFTNSEQLGGKIVDSSYYGSLKWGNGWLKNHGLALYEDSSGWIFLNA